ncbi:MAG: hypothetical protein HC819_13795 [Cyclobacteriaceae bacterium]|nr:hypothetical protein [Cyclobacteriaceae bacterium]
MKKQGINLILAVFFLISGWTAAQAQAQMEVPGDNFSLEGALELFKTSGSPEEFEKMLNDPDSKVNNLDLNVDGYIDYIRVIDRNEGNVHLFIMQAVISESQAQDVAVITLEKMANGKAVLQITGDEDVYGVETIIEPTAEVRTYGGARTSRVTVNVWAWPSVQYIYGPYYSPWISPWGWGFRPVWWSPWRPMAYYDYYPYWRPYHAYYSPCYVHRTVYIDRIYRPHRTTSVVVVNRHRNQIERYRSSRVSNSRSSTTVNRSNGRQSGSSSVRYDANGRLSASNSARSSSRTSMSSRSESDNNRSAVRSNGSSNSRSGSDLRTGSSSSEVQRSSRSRSSNSGENNNSGARQSSSRTDQNGSSVDKNAPSDGSNSRYQRGSGSTSGNRSYGSSSGSNQRSASPNVQRSSGSSNGRQSGSSYNNQRSSSVVLRHALFRGSSQRSSGYSAPRSSGGSASPSSSGRSSGGSQRSSGSSSQRGGRQ